MPKAKTAQSRAETTEQLAPSIKCQDRMYKKYYIKMYS